MRDESDQLQCRAVIGVMVAMVGQQLIGLRHVTPLECLLDGLK